MAKNVEQYMSKTRADYGSGVARAKIEDKDNFELKGQFLKELHKVMLRAFPMPLTVAASCWLRNKPFGLITTWEDLKTKFVSKYCPHARVLKKMKEINNFQQESDEHLYQVWERFKELLMKCPQHYLTEMHEVVLFYNGLDVPTRQILDSRGSIPSKSTDLAKITKKQSKPDKIEHEIEKIAQKPDSKTFLRSNRRRVPNIFEPKIRTIEEVVPMANRTMEELLEAPTEGYEEAIVIPKIFAENFEIKTNLLQLVQTNKFHGFERDNPHTHISNFKRTTSTLKYRDVPNDAIKLMLFPYLLEGAVRICNQPSVYAATGTYNQVSPPNRASNQIPPPGFALVQNNPNSFFQNQALTSGTLPSNTVPNSNGEMKAVTTRSGLAYEGHSIPT
nr:reverse transcriptase domain-containing protein [Tanacetum cinerariifolium]